MRASGAMPQRRSSWARGQRRDEVGTASAWPRSRLGGKTGGVRSCLLLAGGIALCWLCLVPWDPGNQRAWTCFDFVSLFELGSEGFNCWLLVIQRNGERVWFCRHRSLTGGGCGPDSVGPARRSLSLHPRPEAALSGCLTAGDAGTTRS